MAITDEQIDYESWYAEYDESQPYFCPECNDDLHYVDDTSELICTECNQLYVLDHNELLAIDGG